MLQRQNLLGLVLPFLPAFPLHSIFRWEKGFTWTLFFILGTQTHSCSYSCISITFFLIYKLEPGIFIGEIQKHVNQATLSSAHCKSIASLIIQWGLKMRCHEKSIWEVNPAETIALVGEKNLSQKGTIWTAIGCSSPPFFPFTSFVVGAIKRFRCTDFNMINLRLKGLTITFWY